MITIGNYDRRRVEAFVNLPITELLALRVAGAFEDADGWVENNYNPEAELLDQRQRFVRGTLKFSPDDRFTAVVRAEYFENGGNGASAFGYKQIGTYIDSPHLPAILQRGGLRPEQPGAATVTG